MNCRFYNIAHTWCFFKHLYPFLSVFLQKKVFFGFAMSKKCVILLQIA